jgi:hypothetical protein
MTRCKSAMQLAMLLPGTPFSSRRPSPVFRSVAPALERRRAEKLARRRAGHTTDHAVAGLDAVEQRGDAAQIAVAILRVERFGVLLDCCVSNFVGRRRRSGFYGLTFAAFFLCGQLAPLEGDLLQTFLRVTIRRSLGLLFCLCRMLAVSFGSRHGRFPPCRINPSSEQVDLPELDGQLLHGRLGPASLAPWRKRGRFKRRSGLAVGRGEPLL